MKEIHRIGLLIVNQVAKNSKYQLSKNFSNLI